MNQPTEPSGQKLGASARQVHLGTALSFIAVLIYLRWVDFQEAEQAAIAAFDETEYEPVLPAHLQWRSYHDAAADRLQSLFAEELPEILERLDVRQAFQPDPVPVEGGGSNGQPGKADVPSALGKERHNPLATHLHRIAPVVAGLGKLGPQCLSSWLAEEPFETPNDQRRVLEVLHQDSSANAHLENYARLEYLHALDLGQDTDFEKLARLFPKADVNCILFPSWIESHSMDEVRAELTRLMGLGKRFPAFSFTLLEIDTKLGTD